MIASYVHYMCVYEIVNLINNHKYIGSSLNGLEWRKKKHLNELRRNNHHNRHLQSAYNLYGENVFRFNVIEEIEDKSILAKKEQEWIDKSKPEYNVMRDIKSHIGIKRSKETCEKISKSLTGKPLSKEHIEKMRKSLTGKKQSKETAEKRSISMKNSPIYQLAVKSKERNEKIKNTRIKNGGYIVSDEQKRKISETLKSKNLQSAISISIQKCDLDGNLICEYPSFIKAEEDNGFWKGALSHNINTLNKSVYKGFRWKRKTES